MGGIASHPLLPSTSRRMSGSSADRVAPPVPEIETMAAGTDIGIAPGPAQPDPRVRFRRHDFDVFPLGGHREGVFWSGTRSVCGGGSAGLLHRASDGPAAGAATCGRSDVGSRAGVASGKQGPSFNGFEWWGLMTGISVDLAGGPGTIGTITCPAADPFHPALRHGHGDPAGAGMRPDTPVTGTPDDAFCGRPWDGPCPKGVSAGRGGALGAALPNTAQAKGATH